MDNLTAVRTVHLKISIALNALVSCIGTMQVQPMQPLLISEKKQARLLGISIRHLINLRNRKLAPYIRLGRSIRYRPDAVEKALQKLTIAER